MELTKCGSQERGHGEDAAGDTPVSGGEQVGNDASSVGQRRGSESAGKEAQDDEGLDIRSPGGTGVERGQGHVSEEEELLATKHLGQRRPEERADGEAQDEHGDAENGDLAGDVELDEDARDAAGEGGAGEGHGQGGGGLDEGDEPLSGV